MATHQKADAGVPARGEAHGTLAVEYRRRWSAAAGKLDKLTTPQVYLPVVAGIVVLLLWEVIGRLSNPILFAPPSQVYLAFVGMVSSGQLGAALATTLNTLAVGYGCSAVVGIALGVLLGRRNVLARIAEPYLDAIYATPRVVITPLVVVWFGVGYTGRLFIVFIGTVIPIILNTAVGVRNARPDLLEVAYSFGVRERALIRHVIIPGAIPYIVAGLRIAAGRALLGVVIAEIFLNLTGIGGIIATAAGYFHTAQMLVGVLVFSVLGIVLMTSLTWLENRFALWKGHGGE